MTEDWAGTTIEDPTIQLASGRFFHLLNPSPEEVFIEDIAAATSKLCRWTGHVTSYFSVAQHSFMVSYNVPEQDALWGLLHDATEAYMGDISRPLKKTLDILAPGLLHEFEKALMDAIAERFELRGDMPSTVKHADNVLLATERRDLMPHSVGGWPDLPEPLAGTIVPLDPPSAERQFLQRFRALTA